MTAEYSVTIAIDIDLLQLQPNLGLYYVVAIAPLRSDPIQNELPRVTLLINKSIERMPGSSREEEDNVKRPKKQSH